MAWRSRRARAAALVAGFVALVLLSARTTEPAPTPTALQPVQHTAVPEVRAEGVAGPAPQPAATAVPGRWDPTLWRTAAADAIDRTTLAAAGVALPEGANVFAARVVDGGGGGGGGGPPAYVLYEAGGGAFSSEFHPASSVKVLAAVGALELAYASGFTGDAVVDSTYQLKEYYDAAIRYSSNEDYDELVRLAGVAWLNERFLPGEGYRATRIQEPYAEGDRVDESPRITLSEDGRELTLPERSGGDYGCDAVNCSTLFDLVDSVRRVVLNAELGPEERFPIAGTDVDSLQDALLGAESWIGPGVVEALGPEAQLYSKPGWSADCVDIGVVVDPVHGRRYLIGVSAPDDGGCEMLATMAADVLTAVAHDDGRDAVRSDGTVTRIR